MSSWLDLYFEGNSLHELDLCGNLLDNKYTLIKAGSDLDHGHGTILVGGSLKRRSCQDIPFSFSRRGRLICDPI